MTDTHAEHRQPHTPYASLQTPPNGDGSKARGDAPAQSGAPEPDQLAAEADRLENLKQALYAAFVAAPKAGIPTALVDLAATYTSALRLQLTLKGYSSMPKRAAKAAVFTAPRAK